MSLPTIVSSETPAGSAKLTLEGLQHWQVRLEREVAQLASDIEATEAMSERWCGKCAEGLHELKALRDQKQQHLEQVEAGINAIRHDLAHAATVVNAQAIIGSSAPGAPLILVPRQVGHPSTGALLQSSVSPPVLPDTHSSSPMRKLSSNYTREMSRNVARQSAILVNSPKDTVTKQLIF